MHLPLSAFLKHKIKTNSLIPKHFILTFTSSKATINVTCSLLPRAEPIHLTQSKHYRDSVCTLTHNNENLNVNRTFSMTDILPS